MSSYLFENTTCLVTGGAGFIGSHTCEALLHMGFDVVAVDNFNDFYSPDDKRDNIKEIAQAAKAAGKAFTCVEGDIRNSGFLDDIFNKARPELVVHLAACAGVRPSIADPALYADVNINGTVNVLECMKKHHVKKLVFASSSSVYGNNQKTPFSESDPVDRPISPYAATKKAGELICHTYHHLYDFSVACLRFFTVYGPRQRPDLAIYKFTKLMLEGRPIPFYGDGSTERDYTYIDDIIDGVLKAARWVDGGQKRYDIFNLGESKTISLRDMVGALENELGLRAQLDVKPLQPGDVLRTFADISHSRSVLGYDPKTDFTLGIKRFCAWYKENRG